MTAVRQRTGQSRSGYYRQAQAGLQPPPIKIGPRASGVPEHEIDAVNAARIAGKTEQEIRTLVAALVARRHLTLSARIRTGRRRKKQAGMKR